MSKDLTISNIHRQNILNNRPAIDEVERELSLGGIQFQGELVFTKTQVAHIVDVDERTIERYLSTHNEELARNGYKLLQGSALKELKNLELGDINVGQSTKALGLFSFKSVLNLSMLLTESEKAREIRSRALDIVIDVMTKKAGDRVYINQRDEDYLNAAFQEYNYRKEFTDAIDACIDSNKNWKYAVYTNKIYKAIFDEEAKEYREILKLKEKDRTRDTFYAEVLDLIASFEAGYAEALQRKYQELGRKLSSSEANILFNGFASQAAFKPLITKAKTIMASRDYSLRDAIHDKLIPYIQAMPEADYERFLGEKSKELEHRIEENLDVYKRLKDR
jgi:hypothetical protein